MYPSKLDASIPAAMRFQVQAHTLTATHLSWSHNDDLLASCSRDRSFCITRRFRSKVPGDEDTFQLVQRIK